MTEPQPMCLRWPEGSTEQVSLNAGQRRVVRSIYRYSRTHPHQGDTSVEDIKARARRDALYEGEQASWVHKQNG